MLTDTQRRLLTRIHDEGFVHATCPTIDMLALSDIGAIRLGSMRISGMTVAIATLHPSWSLSKIERAAPRYGSRPRGIMVDKILASIKSDGSYRINQKVGAKRHSPNYGVACAMAAHNMVRMSVTDDPRFPGIQRIVTLTKF